MGIRKIQRLIFDEYNRQEEVSQDRFNKRSTTDLILSRAPDTYKRLVEKSREKVTGQYIYVCRKNQETPISRRDHGTKKEVVIRKAGRAVYVQAWWRHMDYTRGKEREYYGPAWGRNWRWRRRMDYPTITENTITRYCIKVNRKTMTWELNQETRPIKNSRATREAEAVVASLSDRDDAMSLPVWIAEAILAHLCEDMASAT